MQASQCKDTQAKRELRELQRNIHSVQQAGTLGNAHTKIVTVQYIRTESRPHMRASPPEFHAHTVDEEVCRTEFCRGGNRHNDVRLPAFATQ